MSLRDVAYSGITVTFAIAIVMLIYTVLYDVVTITLYDLAQSSGVPDYILQNLLLMWQWFPVPFLFTCFVWMLYTATISGRNSY